MNTAEEKELNVPQLNKEERLSLQNIMLRMALEQERIGKLQLQIHMANKELSCQEALLKMWQSAFNGKLKSCNLEIEQVDIDAETGRVTVSRPTLVRNLCGDK
jgi:hypothetical protein